MAGESESAETWRRQTKRTTSMRRHEEARRLAGVGKLQKLRLRREGAEVCGARVRARLRVEVRLSVRVSGGACVCVRVCACVLFRWVCACVRWCLRFCLCACAVGGMLFRGSFQVKLDRRLSCPRVKPESQVACLQEKTNPSGVA